ncbi:hypothetical protein [Bosea robiniae]|uniref:hypothetical protein n=1 Tax=Bosea robiniae TaxID=1036780 RepID=UPI0011134436|nr:hypothetical protein [Bosea robiniae]
MDPSAPRIGGREVELEPFSTFGSQAHALGWPVIPQSRNGSRKPGKIGREIIRWSAFVENGVTDADHSAMAIWSGRDNVALICGKGTEPGQRVRVIDIDVYDAFRAEKIRALAIEVLGHTPMQRQGMAPKWVLLYREALSASRQMRGRKLNFASNSAAAIEAGSTDAIEVLAGGSLITIYGYHHRTQRPFFWPWGENFSQPNESGPETLPEIDADKVDEFLRRLHEVEPIAGFVRATSVSSAFDEIEYDPTLRIATPGHRQRRGVWDVRGGRDVVFDGRKDWTMDRTLAWVLHNAPHVRAGGPALAQIRKRAIEEALRYVERSGDWHSDAAIERRVAELFDRTAAKLVEGAFRERTVHIADDGKAYAKPEGVFAIERRADADLDFVRSAKKRRRSPSNILSATPACGSVAAQRALLSKDARIAAGQQTAATIDATIRGFLTPLWDARDALALDPEHVGKLAAAEDDEKRSSIRRAGLRRAMSEALEAIRLLKSPTGSGKTTMTVRIIRELVQARGSLGMPIAFMLPSHNNIAEVQGTALEEASPEQISAIWDEVLKEASGLRSMAWMGKITAGCHYSEQMSALYTAGLPGSGLCRQRVKTVGGDWEEKVCPMASACAAMAQLALVEHADIVFLPHAYLTLPIPRQLKESVCAVFIDEAIWSQVAQVAFLPLESLRLPRAEPRLSKKDKEAGVDAFELVIDREKAAEVATRALIAGKDVAQTFFEFTDRRSNGRPFRGRELVESALDVCRRADHDGLEVKPAMTMAQVEVLTSRPQSKDLWLEKRFWTLVEERLTWLELDAKSREQAKISGHDFDESKRLAKHSADRAIQYLTEHDVPGGKRDVVRVAWFRKLNFIGLPTFLMDASANPDLLRVVFTGREIEVTEVEVPLHLRVVLIPETASDLSLLPTARHRDMAGRIRAADRQVEVRSMIGRVATMYGHTRVLVASTKAVRGDLMQGAYPDNVDFGHYGAMKGLNFASRHGAMVCVGRMTSPVAVIDGYAGLFARCSEIDELPYDVEGTGKIDGKDLRAHVGERRVQLRNGGDLTLACTGYPDHMKWHNAINRQFREEEIRQAIGRLRPVYRDDETAPVAFVMATCLPEGIIVDDVVTLYDLMEDNPRRVDLASIVGRLGGVLDPIAGGRIAPDIGTDTAISDAIGRLEHRELLGYSSARVWEDGGAEPREVKIAPWVSNIGEALRSASHIAGRELDRFDVWDLIEADTTTRRKAADALDRALSTLPNADTASIEEIRAARRDAAVAELEAAWEKWGHCALTLDGQRLEFGAAIILARHGILPSEVKPPPWRVATPIAA